MARIDWDHLVMKGQMGRWSYTWNDTNIFDIGLTDVVLEKVLGLGPAYKP